MSSIYKQVITDENPVQFKSVKAVAFMCFGLAFLMVILGDYIPGAVVLVTGFAALYFKKYLLVSFQYEISDEKVYIDKIMANKNTKRVFSFHITDIIVIAPENSKKLKEMKLKPVKTLKLYPKRYLKGIYNAMVKVDDKIYKIKMIPDIKFLELCQKFNKTSVIKE